MPSLLHGITREHIHHLTLLPRGLHRSAGCLPPAMATTEKITTAWNPSWLTPCRLFGDCKTWRRGPAFPFPSGTPKASTIATKGIASSSVRRKRRAAPPQILIPVIARCLGSSRGPVRSHSEVVRGAIGWKRRLDDHKFLIGDLRHCGSVSVHGRAPSLP